MGFLKLADGLGHLMQAIAQKIVGGKDARALLQWVREPAHLFSLLAMREFVFLRKDAQSVRQFLADFFAGEIVTIADQQEQNLEKSGREKGEGLAEMPRDNPETVARSKLRIDTRRWLMEQFSPVTYGPVKPPATSTTKPKGLLGALRAKIYLPDNQRAQAGLRTPLEPLDPPDRGANAPEASGKTADD